jgi:D-glycero-D-manno-heptose 1,7-bisphosphate phosphatase
MHKAVFLDRDGVINEVIFRNENTLKPIAPWSMEEFSLLSGIKCPLLNLKKLEFKLFVVTNQPDIAKGVIDHSFVTKVNEVISREFPIDEIRVCPHVDLDGCECRKPKSGMILSLAKKWNIDCQNSFLIGDSWRDMEAGKKAGSTTILLEKHYNRGVEADYKINNLSQVAEIINKIDSCRQSR